ncbi:MAG: hypothetical protein ACN6OP_22555, partial [Pseudomonadales bacterium]
MTEYQIEFIAGRLASGTAPWQESRDQFVRQRLAWARNRCRPGCTAVWEMARGAILREGTV